MVHVPTYVFFSQARLDGASLLSVDHEDLRWLCHKCALGYMLWQVNLRSFALCFLLLLLLPFTFWAVRVVEP